MEKINCYATCPHHNHINFSESVNWKNVVFAHLSKYLLTNLTLTCKLLFILSVLFWNVLVSHVLSTSLVTTYVKRKIYILYPHSSK